MEVMKCLRHRTPTRPAHRTPPGFWDLGLKNFSIEDGGVWQPAEPHNALLSKTAGVEIKSWDDVDYTCVV